MIARCNMESVGCCHPTMIDVDSISKMVRRSFEISLSCNLNAECVQAPGLLSHTVHLHGWTSQQAGRIRMLLTNTAECTSALHMSLSWSLSALQCGSVCQMPQIERSEKGSLKETIPDLKDRLILVQMSRIPGSDLQIHQKATCHCLRSLCCLVADRACQLLNADLSFAVCQPGPACHPRCRLP